MSIIWRGSKSLQEMPRHVLEETLEQDTREYEFEGPYSVCLAQRPAPASIYGAVNQTITKVRVERLKGGRGRLTISCQELQPGDILLNQPKGVTYELEWVEEDVDLLNTPRYTSGGKALSDDDRVALKAWEDEPNWKIKKNFKYREDTSKAGDTQKELSTNAKDYAGKVLKGITSVRWFHPVARRTTRVSNPAKGDGCNKVTNSPGIPNYPSGYTWIKTADRSVKNGNSRWERSEEWTGFAFIDRDLYP